MSILNDKYKRSQWLANNSTEKSGRELQRKRDKKRLGVEKPKRETQR